MGLLLWALQARDINQSIAAATASSIISICRKQNIDLLVSVSDTDLLWGDAIQDSPQHHVCVVDIPKRWPIATQVVWSVCVLLLHK